MNVRFLSYCFNCIVVVQCTCKIQIPTIQFVCSFESIKPSENPSLSISIEGRIYYSFVYLLDPLCLSYSNFVVNYNNNDYQLHSFHFLCIFISILSLF